MSRSTSKRQKAIVKAEPDLSAQGSAAGCIEVDTSRETVAPGSRRSASSVAGTVDVMPSSRFGRSDAPTPSERLMTEPELLLKEVRSVREQPGLTVGSPVNAGESFLRSSFRDIGKQLKKCNDTLGELQQLGVSHEVQLPELVLVGDQSAGKSSLMSGLAHLNLPRSEGTCTRCPLHIRVSKNSDWSCRVWLRKDYHYMPPPDRDVVESDVTEEDPFFPWKKRPATLVHEFKTMHDCDEIENVLRWAQIAILNDDKHPRTFVPDSGSTALELSLEKAAEDTVAKFSPNVVALEIKGPGLPDLSFYDMPGIFENPADARDDYLVNVVQNLTKNYMSHQSAIIMCCMPMNSDAENSSTFRLTRKLGATNRTIGVLTKADLLPEGNHEQWLNIMKGQAHHTGLGYFITSRPPTKDLEDLTKWENSVFEEQSFERWPRTFHPFTSRCGIEKLITFLSEKLGEEFQKSLPTIKRKVINHRDKINKQLENLPELPDNVEAEIQRGLLEFEKCSSAKMDAFVKHFNELPQNFLACLLAIKPKFTLKDKTDTPVVEISDDESEISSVAPSLTTPTSKRLASCHVTPSKRQRLATNGNMGSAYIKPEEENTPVPAGPRPKRDDSLPEPFTGFKTIGRGFRTLRQVHDEMCAKTNAGMPDRFSDDVYVDLVKEAVEPWKGPMDAFIKKTMKDLQADLDATLNKAMASLKKRFVYRETRRHVRQCLEDHCKDVERALIQLYDDEKERMLTFNTEAFTRYKEEELQVLKKFRTRMRAEARVVRMLDMPDAVWEKKCEAEAAKLGPDRFGRQLEVVAYVRGYYRLAAYRFADAVSQKILCRMIPDIRRHLPQYLDEKLGLKGPEAKHMYVTLMEEDQATAAKREALKSERNKFQMALASIEHLEAGGAGRGADGDDSTQPMSGDGIMDADHDVDIFMDDA
ncbi:hypothetical protein XA68_17539 [Ophiocordyceps unilateralis]|uniref:GED domain-containing protein n=1 Tax=Ophiocordyceps unilateralis TaxID=268505 RepID=A0A2A9PK02_OPHUN|nr:hypothetical protein XA68_17539 [Ophiocordyceps unilateralis]